MRCGGGDAKETGLVLERLAAARLIVVGEDSVEVTHEALIRSWPRLRGWLTEDRERLRLHRQLTRAAQEWMRSAGAGRAVPGCSSPPPRSGRHSTTRT